MTADRQGDSAGDPAKQARGQLRGELIAELLELLAAREELGVEGFAVGLGCWQMAAEGALGVHLAGAPAELLGPAAPRSLSAAQTLGDVILALDELARAHGAAAVVSGHVTMAVHLARAAPEARALSSPMRH
jgi:hypothetical protein